MENQNFRDLQKIEAENRILQLGFVTNVLDEFHEGVLNKSERVGFPGILFWLDEKEKAFIEKWQKESGNIAYHVIKDNTNIGTMYSILYVSKYDEEWEMDNDDIKEGRALAYCGIGLGDSYEYGSIGIRPVNGGLERTW